LLVLIWFLKIVQYGILLTEDILQNSIIDIK
jgi:hypothetical protein